MSTKSLEECNMIARKIWFGQDRYGCHRLGMTNGHLCLCFISMAWTTISLFNSNGHWLVTTKCLSKFPERSFQM